MTKYIIDISHYHPITNWKLAKQQSLVIIMKATEGNTYTDPYLLKFVKGCEEWHIPYFLYCFPRKNHALENVKFFHETVKKVKGKYFQGVALDVENALNGTRPLAGEIEIALKYLEERYDKVMLYTGYSQKDIYKDVIENRGKNTIWWEARYSTNECHKGVDLWQYTSNKHLAGFSGGIDISKVKKEKFAKWFYNLELTGRVNVKSLLNVRERPTSESNILTKLPNGTVCKILETVGNGWLRIATDDFTGYVSEKYIEKL